MHDYHTCTYSFRTIGDVVDVKQKQHYRSKGLSDDDIRMLETCNAQCTGCLCNGDCEIQRVYIGDDDNAE